MALIIRNDEQIKVGTTPGLTAGSSSFIFDGTGGKPDYRFSEIVPSELEGRGIMVKGLDYTWDYTLAKFDLIIPGDIFAQDQWYNIHFQPVAQPITVDHYSVINSSFFIRDINLVNLTKPEILDRLNYFIQRYEPQCLTKLLGYPLYKLFLEEPSQRINDLLYGVEYIGPTGIVRKWQGIVHDLNLSLIAHYVYYWFQNDTALITTGTGTKSTKPEVGKAESPRDKMICAWRFFASEARDCICFLWNQKNEDGSRTYPEFTVSQYYSASNMVRPGGVNAYGF